LADALRINTSLRKFSIDSDEFTQYAVNVIIEALQDNLSIEALKFGIDCPLEMTNLVEMLEVNRNISSLFLRIDDDCLEKLTSVLVNDHSRIVKLVLAYGFISNCGDFIHCNNLDEVDLSDIT
jgi:hypothetical protein